MDGIMAAGVAAAIGAPVAVLEGATVLVAAGVDEADADVVALPALSSTPSPQGMAGLPPSGWFAFGGGTVAPLGSAIANRVVHRGVVLLS